MLSAQGLLLWSGPCFFWELPIRTRVYVDGFNLYYGALKDTPFKWLDPVKLAYQLLPAGYSVSKLKYFTARVSGIPDAGAPARQQAYLSALATLPEVQVLFGKFLSKTIWRPLTNLPVAGRRIGTPNPVIMPAGDHSVSGPAQTLPVGTYRPPAKGTKKRRKRTRPRSDAVVTEVHTMEEKGSDVNLAAHLLNDAWKKSFDAAVVISNDTDLVTPIRMVSVEQGKPVFVVCPGGKRMARPLAAVATRKRHVRPSMLRAAQFPRNIPGISVSKPATW